MCSEIMALPNDLVYSGQLASGSDAVATASLHLPSPASLDRHPAWLRPLVAPAVKVAFLNTDPPPAAARPPGGEVQLREGTVNPGEARAVVALVRALLDCGVPAGEIGVVSPYRAQVSHLQCLLAAKSAGARGGGGGPADPAASSTPAAAPGDAATTPAAAVADAGGVEVLTIDRYQGRDKAVILLSLVRSNAHGAAGQLLTDWQRLNVALTRARVKLLLVGSAKTLAGVPLLGRLVAMAEEGGWMVQLPDEATAAV
jgi:DNA replication ATP-dependent helicase Dna2